MSSTLPTNSPTGQRPMNTKRVNAAADVIHRAMQQGKTLPVSLATALDATCMLQSPESAAELDSLRARVAELEKERHATNEWVADAAEALRVRRDRIAQLEAQLGRAAEQRHLVDPLDHAFEALAPRMQAGGAR